MVRGPGWTRKWDGESQGDRGGTCGLGGSDEYSDECSRSRYIQPRCTATFERSLGEHRPTWALIAQGARPGPRQSRYRPVADFLEPTDRRGTAGARAPPQTGLTLTEIIATPLRTSPFDGSPLRQYQAQQEQAMLDGPQPSVVLRLSPYVGSTPQQEYTARQWADVTSGEHPLAAPAAPVSAVQTPAYTRGTYTPVSGHDISVSVDLGPVLWNRVERGGVGQLINVTA